MDYQPNMFKGEFTPLSRFFWKTWFWLF